MATINGTVALKRTVLVPADGDSRLLLQGEGRSSIVPLDMLLGLDLLPFKMTRRMMLALAFWGQNQSSFQNAEKIVMAHYRTNITDDMIRTICNYVGRAVHEEDTRRAEAAMEKMGCLDMPCSEPGILYLEVDGAAINTRSKDKNGSSWRENKLGVVFSNKDIRKRKTKKGEWSYRIQQKEYVSFLGKADDFKKYLFESAVRNGYGRYRTTIMLSDGATWIRNMGNELFPDAVQILDFYHLCENTHTFAEHIRPQETEAKEWAKGILERLRKSEWEEVLEGLAKYEEKTFPAGVVNLYTYLLNNKDKIDYKSYEEKGYYIGSGVVESGNKTVLQKRCKQAGMRWEEMPAQYMLTLRAKEESGLWNSYVEPIILNYKFNE